MMIRLIKAAFLLLLLTTSTAHGTETLLMQYTDQSGTFDNPGLSVEFQAYSASSGTVDFSQHFSFHADLPVGDRVYTTLPADGTLYTANSATVAGMEGCLKTACTIHFLTGDFHGEHTLYSPDEIWSYQPRYNERLVMFVPKLGPGLAGYRVTSITRTISNAALWFEYKDYTHYFGYYHGNIAQTVRIYGEAIPEPTGILLLPVGLVGLVLAAHRR